ncbi:5-oxoprolinase subunit PxpA [Maribrevibacterium harenarium]|uniref:5-oxoprolinase subunit PxpA n=1 Tax=Maribrevibacterium harenarium TaxID=2589817 RepID=A0A501X376_9GAMM|nr:5-oxoprolinase subunit PxpA [Maribrevibacterium harenarium]TPE54942.1 5-oxoprolinase subunit PxpA [Maribrevibacterium harenarium]
MAIQLNCDLGESFGAWKMGMDAAVMPFIDQANIACGFHAGDPLVMRKTLQLAKEHGVTVGAHPAYPDLVGFGRRSMACQPAEIIAMVQYQVAAIDGMAKSLGMELAYVKPHGAMYNDMMAKTEVRLAIMEAIATYHRPLALMLQATPESAAHRQEAADKGIGVMFEAFADRCYDDDGKLLSRTKPGAVHTREKMLAQVAQICREGTVTTVSGHTLSLDVDTLCVHGDNDEGIAAIAEIRQVVKS